MKTIVDKELCIGCGLCEGICPDVYEMNDNDKSDVKVNPVSAEFEDCALEAESGCPVDAISHKD